ncbi:hypothetical protein MNBD_ALPHA03-2023 [hydrothermal vent metagenome]|uniref:Flagellar protein FliL n=1 Tax=hydrothermal vent metagenome TaxID=652676 RepID=A0A3B1AT21_9ZZZZ
MAKEEDKKAENTEDTPVEEKPKGSSKKLLVIGLLLGLLLGGGAGFGAFMMLSGSDAPAEQNEEVVVKKEEPKIDAHFVKVERVNIPLVSKGRVVGNLIADFSIKVDGNDNKMEVIVNLPEIRDAILRHFSGKSIGKKNNPRSIDYPMLKQAIKDISNKILKKPLVLDVMVVQVKQF